jgi:hypothetical protein
MISFALSYLIMAQAMPIPKAGGSCPLNFYSSGRYCVPSASNKTQWAIQKTSSSCPLNAYSSGRYCVKSYGQ